MALVLKMIYKFYHEEINHYNDPRTQTFFLSKNIFIPLAIAIVYYKFVTNWGPRYMKDRPPFKLKTLLTAYNLLQIILSIRLVYMVCIYMYFLGPYKFKCEPVDYSRSALGLRAANEVHNYFLLKILDLLDTVFFVLRKKQKQVTFLHLYHHIGMTFGAWIAVRFFPGGHLIFIGFINSFVHTLMYSYYLLALHKNSAQIWWKKYITLTQIFAIITLHWIIMLVGPSCGFPKMLGLIFLPQNTFMLAMFSEFYYRTYIKNKH